MTRLRRRRVLEGSTPGTYTSDHGPVVPGLRRRRDGIARAPPAALWRLRRPHQDPPGLRRRAGVRGGGPGEGGDAPARRAPLDAHRHPPPSGLARLVERRNGGPGGRALPAGSLLALAHIRLALGGLAGRGDGGAATRLARLLLPLPAPPQLPVSFDHRSLLSPPAGRAILCVSRGVRQPSRP